MSTDKVEREFVQSLARGLAVIRSFDEDHAAMSRLSTTGPQYLDNVL